MNFPNRAESSDQSCSDLYSHDFWQKHIESYERQQELNKTEYCRKHNLIYNRFWRWHKKLSKQMDDFIPVKISNDQSTTKNAASKGEALCSLEFSSGHRLMINNHEAFSFLLEKLL
jgi:hypothetical protein